MADAQSRYGIMKDLNERKITEREALAGLEDQKANTVSGGETKISELKKELNSKDATYIEDHKAYLKLKQFEIDAITRDYDQSKIDLEETIKAKNENYVPEHESWVAKTKAKIISLEKDINTYSIQIDRKIANKRQVIKDIDEGIDDVKDISKESKENKGD